MLQNVNTSKKKSPPLRKKQNASKKKGNVFKPTPTTQRKKRIITKIYTREDVIRALDRYYEQ